MFPEWDELGAVQTRTAEGAMLEFGVVAVSDITRLRKF